MDFSGIAWWAYGATALAGLAFGILQSLLVKSAVMGKQPRHWLYPLKLGLWAAALLIMGLISPPLLVVFAVVASITLLVGSAIFFRKAQKEAR